MRLTRSATIAVNTLSSYGRFGVAFVVWFFLTPVIVRNLGAEAFGLWVLLTAIFGFGSLLDLGLGTSIVRYVGSAKATADWRRRNRIISTIGATYLAIAVVTAILIGLLLPHLVRALDLSTAQQTTAQLLIVLLAGRVVIITLPLGIFRGLLFGEQLIYLINGVQAGTLIIHGVVAWLVLESGQGLLGLATVAIGTLTLEHLAYVWLAYRNVPRLHLSWRLVDRALLAEVSSFSIHSFAVTASALVLLRTDPILVKLFLPLSAVATYAIAMKIAEQAHLVLKQFVNALSPLIAELQSQGDVKRLRQILISGTKFAVAPAVLALVGLGIFGRQAITLWLDPSFASAWPVLMVLMTAMVVSVPELVAANVLTMSGHYRLPARASVVSAAVNVVVSLILAMRFGMMGIAVGTLIAAVLVNGVVVAAALRVHDLSWNDYIRRALRPHLIPAAGATALGLVIRDVIDPSSLGIIVVGFVALPRCLPGCSGGPASTSSKSGWSRIGSWAGTCQRCYSHSFEAINENRIGLAGKHHSDRSRS